MPTSSRTTRDSQLNGEHRTPTQNGSPCPLATAKAAAQPECPRCGAAMALRTARQGANAGNTFWGCSTYPKCRGTVAAS